jgi:hypothetical protein
MATREHYSLTASTVPELVTQLNFILARIQDRLDKIEGVRGTSSITTAMQVTVDGNIVHGFNTSDET